MRRNWCLEEGFFVCITIKNLPVTILIDSVSNITILSKSFLEKLPPESLFCRTYKDKNVNCYRGGNSFSGKNRT